MKNIQQHRLNFDLSNINKTVSEEPKSRINIEIEKESEDLPWKLKPRRVNQINKFALETWRTWFSTQLRGDTALTVSYSDSGTQ